MMGRPHHRQRGTSLIEALVALLVLALGVMGMAAVQTRALTTARTTNLRAVAIQAAEDLQDRIQANADLRHMPALVNPYVTTWGPPPATGTDCSSAPCGGTPLATFDLMQWKKELARVLPAGDGRVFASTKDATQLGILVRWTEAKARNEAQAGKEEAALFRQAVAVRGAADQPGAGVSGELCPDTFTCHLIFVRP
ncbi:MAG: type IV pilus modification protein PilV [Hydrogenophaga sp.]|nr:type IV pilus modification protein PilV [Hydrogenophaga sp.]